MTAFETPTWSWCEVAVFFIEQPKLMQMSISSMPRFFIYNFGKIRFSISTVLFAKSMFFEVNPSMSFLSPVQRKAFSFKASATNGVSSSSISKAKSIASNQITDFINS